MSTTERRAVKFLHAWRGYSAGEVAGFDEKVAEQLVNGKVAEEYVADGDKTSATQAPAKAPAQRATASGKRGGVKADAPAPAPAPGEGSGQGAPAEPDAGNADPSTSTAADGGQTDAAAPAAGTGSSAGNDNDERP